MEIGECSVVDEDGKPAALPQHLTTTTIGLDDVATAESGIVSFSFGCLAYRYWMNTEFLVSALHFTLLWIVLHLYDVSE
jgi:hypothetical protein